MIESSEPIGMPGLSKDDSMVEADMGVKFETSTEQILIRAEVNEVSSSFLVS